MDNKLNFDILDMHLQYTPLRRLSITNTHSINPTTRCNQYVSRSNVFDDFRAHFFPLQFWIQGII